MSFMYCDITSSYCCNYLSPPYHSLSIRQEAEKLTSTRHLQKVLNNSGMATAIMVTIKQTNKKLTAREVQDSLRLYSRIQGIQVVQYHNKWCNAIYSLYNGKTLLKGSFLNSQCMYKNIQLGNLYYPVSHTSYVQHNFTSLIKDTNMYLHVKLTINSFLFKV